MQRELAGGVYCVGCGSDLTSKSTERRSLQNSASEHVATVWRALHQHIVDQEEPDTDIDADMIVSGGGDPAQSGRMCRKCFAAYERYQALQKSLLSNLKKALGVIPSTFCSRTKRIRVDTSRPIISPPVRPLQQTSSSTSASPDVAVNFYSFRFDSNLAQIISLIDTCWIQPTKEIRFDAPPEASWESSGP